ncbi:peptidoglycan editing factor PgeF [Phenylobacterium montanum]|uniref:Purine nucleoside phosphorylase n=1 Tax=Phenylobacterium montanum TaxID=2823693 RepID=A0A975ITZ0_9CAUL|nr:peptidoglycan editing factor PgeF [Caulobacter sp. S6]QUD87258.1 peptidoglycan editing factor PgeF [Caulobacter sp. S6]
MTPEPLQSPLLAGLAGVRHGFFTRRGGVSEGIYAGLNVGRGSKDDPAAVRENRARAAGFFNVGEPALLCAYQVHSSLAHRVDGIWEQPPQVDALVTTEAGLVCGALSADCAPILIADARARVVASAHAGWRGALTGVVEAAVEAMKAAGAEPQRMIAAVGPCIGPKSYEVGLEFLDRFMAESPGSERFFAPGVSAEKRLFDLPGYVLSRLNAAGVAKAEWIGADTLADEAQFFSNRRAVLRGDGDYGRLLSAIMLEG